MVAKEVVLKDEVVNGVWLAFEEVNGPWLAFEVNWLWQAFKEVSLPAVWMGDNFGEIDSVFALVGDDVKVWACPFQFLGDVKVCARSYEFDGDEVKVWASPSEFVDIKVWADSGVFEELAFEAGENEDLSWSLGERWEDSKDAEMLMVNK